MKKVFCFYIAFSCVTLCMSQILLEHQYYIYHKAFYISEIGENNYKYVVNDSIGFSLYNLDHSPYLLNFVSPIPLGVPPSYYQVAYISTSLFDCDSNNIEYVITRPDHFSNFYIYRTDGTMLFQKDSVTGYFSIGYADGSVYQKPIVNTPNGTKLFLSDNKYSGQDSLYVYSLCGNVPVSIKEMSTQEKVVSVYPNPSSDKINFDFNLPIKSGNLKLIIYNSLFKRVKEVNLDENCIHFYLNNNEFIGGSYFFELRSKDKVYETGKFVISK